MCESFTVQFMNSEKKKKEKKRHVKLSGAGSEGWVLFVGEDCWKCGEPGHIQRNLTLTLPVLKEVQVQLAIRTRETTSSRVHEAELGYRY